MYPRTVTFVKVYEASSLKHHRGKEIVKNEKDPVKKEVILVG